VGSKAVHTILAGPEKEDGMITRKRRIIAKLERMFPGEKHRVRIDRLAGGDPTVEIWSTALNKPGAEGRIKGAIVEKYLFVHLLEGE